MPSPSRPLPLEPAQPPGRAGPGTNSSQLPCAHGGAGKGNGHFRRQLAVCGSRGPIPLTPTQRSATCAQPAGVRVAGRELCEGVAARDRGGDKAVSGGAVAQPPVAIGTCTTPGQPGPGTNSSQVPSAQGGAAKGSGHFWRQRWQCVAAASLRASLTPAHRYAIGAQPAGVTRTGRDLCEGVAARDRGGDKARRGGA